MMNIYNEYIYIMNIYEYNEYIYIMNIYMNMNDQCYLDGSHPPSGV